MIEDLSPSRCVRPSSGQPVLVWRAPEPFRCISSAAHGGGLGDRAWVLNAEVDKDYSHPDPDADLAALASELALPTGWGAALMTAARVSGVVVAFDGDAGCAATVGVTRPTWAAGPDGSWSGGPGTINLVCTVPVGLSDAALVNAVMTATEAKTQALLEAGVPGTGTASDAVVVACPPGGHEPYGGPRSVWGARLARAVHAAVAQGLHP